MNWDFVETDIFKKCLSKSIAFHMAQYQVTELASGGFIYEYQPKTVGKWSDGKEYQREDLGSAIRKVLYEG